MRYVNWCIAIAVLSTAALSAVPAKAQDADESAATEERAEIVIEIDEQGRLLVDGEPVSNENGRVVVRIAPEADVDIDRRGERGRALRGPARHSGRRVDVDRLVRRGDHGFLSGFMADFEPPHIPPIAPMIEHFRFNWDGDLGAHLEEHREVAEFERASRELAREARGAEGAEREALEAELRSKLEEIFEQKMDLRQERIERMEERLEEEREEYDERAAERETIVDRRLRELLGESEALEW